MNPKVKPSKKTARKSGRKATAWRPSIAEMRAHILELEEQLRQSGSLLSFARDENYLRTVSFAASEERVLELRKSIEALRKRESSLEMSWRLELSRAEAAERALEARDKQNESLRELLAVLVVFVAGPPVTSDQLAADYPEVCNLMGFKPNFRALDSAAEKGYGFRAHAVISKAGAEYRKENA